MHAPVPVSQVAPDAVWHAGGELQVVGVPDTHEPDWHESPVVQALPSEQDVPFVSLFV